MVKTTDLVADLRVCRHSGCSACGHDCGTAACIDHVIGDAADKIEELVDRCARYAEEIAVLREKLRRVPVAERLPEKDGKYLCWYGFDPNRNALFCQVLDYYATDPMPHFQHEGLNGMTVTHWMEIPGVEAG